jgi:hypothetical protein
VKQFVQESELGATSHKRVNATRIVCIAGFGRLEEEGMIAALFELHHYVKQRHLAAAMCALIQGAHVAL